MPPDSATPSKGSGMLSLYANLLDPGTSSSATSSASISREPILFTQTSSDSGAQADASVKKQQINPAALRFQPTKRPQLPVQKSKPKAPYSKPVSGQASLSIPDARSAPAPAPSSARPPAKITLADWTATGDDEDVNGFYGGEKRQRGGRKKRKKNREEVAVPQDWDDIYDPSRPNNYEEYKHSDEKIREIRDWKDRLYAHRTIRRYSSDFESDDDDRGRQAHRAGFAAPPTYSFAPPPQMDSESPPPPPPLPNPTDLPDDPTGEDAYTRRVRLSQAVPPPPSPPPPPPPLPEMESESPAAAPGPKPPQPTPTISRAPVRYNLPAADSSLPSTDAELEAELAKISQPASPGTSAYDDDNDNGGEPAPRSLRPGQAGFAERLMSKYGWSRGKGLGASNSGIINPLRVQMEKQKKKPDSEGGGFVGPGGRGKILGGRRPATTLSDADDDVGAMSEVVELRGMLDGMDIDSELVGGQGLMQEIGEECGDKYGRVERVFIDRQETERPRVFIKFTSALSALRAVNALSGRIFNGNTIAARFFDADRFEQGHLR